MKSLRRLLNKKRSLITTFLNLHVATTDGRMNQSLPRPARPATQVGKKPSPDRTCKKAGRQMRARGGAENNSA